MNHKMVEYAWENSPLTGSQFIVHLALAADSSNAGYCWSTVNHLARQSKCSYMTVRNAIKALEAKDMLRIEEMYGHKQVFHLIVDGQTDLGDEEPAPPEQVSAE